MLLPCTKWILIPGNIFLNLHILLNKVPLACLSASVLSHFHEEDDKPKPPAAPPAMPSPPPPPPPAMPSSPPSSGSSEMSASSSALKSSSSSMTSSSSSSSASSYSLGESISASDKDQEDRYHPAHEEEKGSIHIILLYGEFDCPLRM